MCKHQKNVDITNELYSKCSSEVHPSPFPFLFSVVLIDLKVEEGWEKLRREGDAGAGGDAGGGEVSASGVKCDAVSVEGVTIGVAVSLAPASTFSTEWINTPRAAGAEHECGLPSSRLIGVKWGLAMRDGLICLWGRAV